jgi:hypothetical protein
MYTNRLTKIILSAALILATVVALQVYKSLANPESDVPAPGSYVGMGDVHRYEWQASNRNATVPGTNRSYVGMGNLRCVEAQDAIQKAGAPGSDHPYIGMGDLKRFEALQGRNCAGGK